MKTPRLVPEAIEKKILLLRGQKVMLDRDLAQLYGVQTRDLNKAVRRNPDRFPPDFMFHLTAEEFESLKFQFGTSSWGGTRKLPHAFTEQGVAMLSSVLHSKRAVQVNMVPDSMGHLLHHNYEPKRRIGFGVKEQQALSAK